MHCTAPLPQRLPSCRGFVALRLPPAAGLLCGICDAERHLDRHRCAASCSHTLCHSVLCRAVLGMSWSVVGFSSEVCKHQPSAAPLAVVHAKLRCAASHPVLPHAVLRCAAVQASQSPAPRRATASTCWPTGATRRGCLSAAPRACCIRWVPPCFQTCLPKALPACPPASVPRASHLVAAHSTESAAAHLCCPTRRPASVCCGPCRWRSAVSSLSLWQMRCTTFGTTAGSWCPASSQARWAADGQLTAACWRGTIY